MNTFFQACGKLGCSTFAYLQQLTVSNYCNVYVRGLNLWLNDGKVIFISLVVITTFIIYFSAQALTIFFSVVVVLSVSTGTTVLINSDAFVHFLFSSVLQ